MISLEGYRRLNPNYKRNSINVYLGDGVAYDAFSEILKRDYGVLNVYRGVADAKYEAAKARAEEKISFYMEHYNIDSVEYAVIYKGDIILSGSSREYQIEKITDYGEFLSASIGTYSVMIPMIAQAIIAVSLVIVTLILMMTVRAIVAKRRRELGMLKAAGYTARQLAGQMAISFMPMTAAGVVAGCAGGALSIGPMMGGMLSFAGAQSAAFGINPSVVIALGAVTLAVTCAVAYVSSLRIRRISVYELLTE
jgi:ABC-type antimicrobial peptide transport system permease subunit